MAATSENMELLKIVLRAGELAQDNIMNYYLESIGIEWKQDNTPVTIADKSTEEVIRKFFASETPGFGIIGEELQIIFKHRSPSALHQVRYD